MVINQPIEFRNARFDELFLFLRFEFRFVVSASLCFPFTNQSFFLLGFFSLSVPFQKITNANRQYGSAKSNPHNNHDRLNQER